MNQLAKDLRRARQDKGLSQRELSARSGLQQTQISRAENGTIDLRTSSLIELAHALDLEVVLVPRGMVPAVKALSQAGSGETRPAYHLFGEDDD